MYKYYFQVINDINILYTQCLIELNSINSNSMKLKEEKKKKCVVTFMEYLWVPNFKYSKFKTFKICNQFGGLLIYYTCIVHKL